MRRKVSILVFAVAASCAGSLATAQSTGADNAQSDGNPRIPANRGASNGQSGVSSSDSMGMSAAGASSGARSKNARLATVRNHGAANGSQETTRSHSPDGTRSSDKMRGSSSNGGSMSESSGMAASGAVK